MSAKKFIVLGGNSGSTEGIGAEAPRGRPGRGDSGDG